MTDLDRKLVEVVVREVEARRDDAVRLLQELVRVPSTTGEEGAVQEKVEHALRGRGLEVDVWEAKAHEVEPYRDHVGDQETYENRPNVARPPPPGGARGGGGGGGVFFAPPRRAAPPPPPPPPAGGPGGAPGRCSSTPTWIR